MKQIKQLTPEERIVIVMCAKIVQRNKLNEELSELYALLKQHQYSPRNEIFVEDEHWPVIETKSCELDWFKRLFGV
jgi:hypothetical protein